MRNLTKEVQINVDANKQDLRFTAKIEIVDGEVKLLHQSMSGINGGAKLWLEKGLSPEEYINIGNKLRAAIEELRMQAIIPTLADVGKLVCVSGGSTKGILCGVAPENSTTDYPFYVCVNGKMNLYAKAILCGS